MSYDGHRRTDDVYGRFADRDPLLLVALYAGDADVVAEVTRMLRHHPLAVLARHPAALVDVLAGLPELHGRLRTCWEQQDAPLTAQLLAWAAQAQLRITRTGRDLPRRGAPTAPMRAEELQPALARTA